MKKYFLFFPALLCLFLSGCADGSAKLVLHEHVLPVNENASINAICYAENTVYYAQDYGNYLEAAANAGTPVDFSAEYNTCIYAYDADTEEATLLYQYDTDGCVTVTDIQYDSGLLYWEDYLGENDGWRILCLNTDDGSVSTALSAADTDSSQLSVTIFANNAALYWFDLAADGGTYSLFAYEGGLVREVLSHVEAVTPYSHLSVSDGVLPICRTSSDAYQIELYDENFSLTDTVGIESPAWQIKANDDFIVWTDDYYTTYTIHVYDRNSKMFSDLDYDYFFSYALIGNELLVNGGDGLECYNLTSETSSFLMDAAENGNPLFYTHQDFSDNTYALKVGANDTVVVIETE